MLRGIWRYSSHNRESNPSAHGLHSSANHSATPFLAAALFPHRTSSPYDRKHVDLHFLLHPNQSTSGRRQDGASSRHGFPRRSHMFDDVIRPPHHVHSLTTVGIMTGVIVFLTIGATAALALFCCRRNFRLAVKDEEQPEDVEDCQMDELDVIFDDDDVIPLFLSSDSDHVIRTRLELRHVTAYEPDVTFNGVAQRQGIKSSGAGMLPRSHRKTWNRSHCQRGSEVVTPERPIYDSYENSDPEIVTFEPPSLTSEKPEDNDVIWRASSEATGYPVLADVCRDGYRRIETEENGEEEEDEEEEDAEAMETSLEDNNSIDAEFESAETD